MERFEDFGRDDADFRLRVLVASKLDEMPPRTGISGDEDFGFRSVGQDRPRRLTGQLPAKRFVLDRGELGLQAFDQLDVRLLGVHDGQSPDLVQLRDLGDAVRLNEVRDGLIGFTPSVGLSPGRLNLFRLGTRVVIVDFAHNEAGIAAVLDVAEGIAAGAAARAAPVTAIIGTAGDRPDDTLRGIGRIAALRAQRVVIKETRKYLRGRTAESVVGELLAGVESGGRQPDEVPVYPSETAALLAELNGAAGAAVDGGRPDAARVVVLMCQEERAAVFELLSRLGARPVDVATELTSLVPRLQGRPRRG